MKPTIFSLFLISGIIGSCTMNSTQRPPVRLAMTSATDNYINWIHRIDSTVQIIDMKGMSPDSALDILMDCDGILFTGGKDIDPAFYGRPGDTAHCDLDRERDTLELALAAKAFREKIPVFGICRGQQLLNVAKGGSLIVDIPSEFQTDLEHRCEDYTQCAHHVTITKKTLLEEVCQCDTGWVNSNHHQAVATLGNDLIVSARTDDGLIEAIEWADPKDKGYFMAVQWHPERMAPDNPLSDAAGKAFLNACKISRVVK